MKTTKIQHYKIDLLEELWITMLMLNIVDEDTGLYVTLNTVRYIDFNRNPRYNKIKPLDDFLNGVGTWQKIL